MQGASVILMLAAVCILWGGLAVSLTALWVRGKREELEERNAAIRAAHEHLGHL